MNKNWNTVLGHCLLGGLHNVAMCRKTVKVRFVIQLKNKTCSGLPSTGIKNELLSSKLWRSLFNRWTPGVMHYAATFEKEERKIVHSSYTALIYNSQFINGVSNLSCFDVSFECETPKASWASLDLPETERSKRMKILHRELLTRCLGLVIAQLAQTVRWARCSKTILARGHQASWGNLQKGWKIACSSISTDEGTDRLQTVLTAPLVPWPVGHDITNQPSVSKHRGHTPCHNLQKEYEMSRADMQLKLPTFNRWDKLAYRKDLFKCHETVLSKVKVGFWNHVLSLCYQQNSNLLQICLVLGQ